MASLTSEEVAARADAPIELVDRLVALGILTPAPEGDRAFAPSDVHRVRFLLACERAGLKPEAIGQAIARTGLSLGFMDSPQWRWAGVGTSTYADLAEELDLPLDLVLDVVRSLGRARPEPDQRIREDDPSIFALLRILARWLDPETLTRTARVYVDNLRRITEAEASYFGTYIVDKLLEEGRDFGEAIDEANRFGADAWPLQEGLVLTLYRREQERRWTEYAIEHIESILDGLGLYEAQDRPPAVGFIDLSGYTAMTEERGDEEGVRLATALTEMVDAVSSERGGVPVKWLGDGVMVYFRDPDGAVPAMTDMVRRAPSLGSPAHAGIASGPVVSQDGDYYGRTVNLAARLASRASPGQTLVTQEVASLGADPRFGYRGIGSVELRGFTEPIPTFEVSTAP